MAAAHTHLARGIALTIVLAPVAGAAAALCALGFIAGITGWGPRFLEADSPVDFLYGGGPASLLRFAAAVGGGTVALATVGAIRWAYTDDFFVPGQ